MSFGEREQKRGENEKGKLRVKDTGKLEIKGN
jgi:hypothetical protein